MQEKRDELIDRLEKINIDFIDCSLILRLYNILCYVRNKSDGHGMTVVLGYDREDINHRRTIAEMCENTFFKTNDHLNYDYIEEKMHDIRDIDGAILADKEGNILMSGVFFLVNPIFSLKKMGVPREDPRSLPERFGFRTKVGTRHISSISASYKMKNSFIFSLSEETNLIRVFFNGRIFFSEIKEEIETSVYPLVELNENE